MTHARFALVFAAALLLAAFPHLAACGGDGAAGGESSADTGADVAADGEVDAAGDAADDAGDGGTDVGGPKPITVVSEAVPYTLYEWLVADVADPNADPIDDAIEAGTFVAPTAAGVDASGVEWTSWILRPDGSLPEPNGVGYAVAVFSTDEPTGLIAQADRVARVYLGDARQPGDVYGSGRHRIPFVTAAGDNTLVVQTFGGRGDPRFVLQTTPDEVFPNLADVILPDPRVGDTDTDWLGVHTSILTQGPIRDIVARVVASDWLAETEVTYPSLTPAATTQIAFEIAPTVAPTEAEATLPVTLQIESPDLSAIYEFTVELIAVDPTAHHRRTFRSRIDASAQYFGVAPPTDPDASHGLVLSLHGAGVQAIGQARAYAQKESLWIVAPTNRRPFGFDWEVWGRQDGLEILDHASALYDIDPTRVYVTGHSMGGHGTWQFGVLFPGRFAVVGPSAGWRSFDTYGGSPRATGVFGRTQASSFTTDYATNLARRAVYIIHGADDDNVPVSEGRAMAELMATITDDLNYHEQPDAGHWWNVDPEPGADCVDWPGLFEVIDDRRLDPFELEFTFTSPSVWVTPTHSYVTVGAVDDPMADFVLESAPNGDDSVTLTTTNVRSLVIDGAALNARGVTSVEVDGEALDIPDGPLEIGPQDGKSAGSSGPLNQALERPFCFAWADDGPASYPAYAAFLLSTWSIIGGGHGCGLPASEVDDALMAERNIIWLGVPSADIPAAAAIDASWGDGTIEVDGTPYANASLAVVFPAGDRLQAAFYATPGSEHLLFRLQPYTSRFVVPDFLVWAEGGALAGGLFDAAWSFDAGSSFGR